MPLPAGADREEVHLRRIECRGYRRADGLWDIDARMTDTNRYDQIMGAADASTVIHDMWLRLTVDEDLVVHDVVAVPDTTPYSMCPDAAAPMSVLKGLKIGAGWNAEVRRRLPRAAGCTHLIELLGPAATTAYQTLAPFRRGRPDALDRSGRPTKIDSCFAYASGSDVVRERWPAFYTGPRAKSPGGGR